MTPYYQPGLPSRMVIDRLFGSRRQLLDAAEVPVALRRVSGRYRMVMRRVVP